MKEFLTLFVLCILAITLRPFSTAKGILIQPRSKTAHSNGKLMENNLKQTTSVLSSLAESTKLYAQDDVIQVFLDPSLKESDPEFYAKVFNSMERVSTILRQVIFFPAGLKIEVQVEELDLEVLADAIPTAYDEDLEIPNLSDVAIPQALARQLCANETIQPNFETSDIVITINYLRRQDLWVEGSGPIEDKYDLDWVLLHEIVHGLGFTTSFSNHLEDLGEDDSGILLPEIRHAEMAEINMINETSLIQICKPYIYDLFVYSTTIGKTFYQLAQELKPLTQPPNDQLDITSWLAMFRNSPQYQTIIQLNNDINTPGKLILKTSSQMQNEKKQFASNFSPLNINKPLDFTMVLQHRNPEVEFDGGRCIVHLSSELTNTAEFLMTPTAIPGETLQNRINKFGFPFGKNTLSILKAMGYNVLKKIV